MPRIRSHLSFANVISMIALFVALGGASYAAVNLPKNSVGPKQIKKRAVRGKHINKNAVSRSKIQGNAVNGGKVANGSLSGADLADGSVGTADLGDGSVDGAKLGDNSVSSGKITDGSVALADLAEPATGPRAFARVRADGTLETEIEGQTPPGPSQNRGVDATDVQKDAGAPAAESTGPGVYCFGGLDFTPRSALVSLDNTDSMPAVPNVQGGALNFIPSVAIFKGPDLGRCNAEHGQIRVAIERVDQTNPPELVDHGFTIWIYG
jgi:hypothetical protein